jgi:hypothetical protein
MKLLALSIITLTICPSLTIAQEFKRLDGQYAIGSKTLTDPPPDEKKDRLLLSIQGGGAKEIFNSIVTIAKADRCDINLVTKSAGSLECSKSGAGLYQCTIGLSLASGSPLKGRVC